MVKNTNPLQQDADRITEEEAVKIFAELAKHDYNSAMQFNNLIGENDFTAADVIEWLSINGQASLIPDRLKQSADVDQSPDQEDAEAESIEAEPSAEPSVTPATPLKKTAQKKMKRASGSSAPADAPAIYTAAEAHERMKIMQAEGLKTDVFEKARLSDGTFNKDLIDRSYFEQSEVKANNQIRSEIDAEARAIEARAAERAVKQSAEAEVNYDAPAEAIPAFIDELENEKTPSATLDQFAEDGKQSADVEEFEVTGIDRPFTAGTSAPWNRSPLEPVRILQNYNAEDTYKQYLTDLGNQRRLADEATGWIIHDRPKPHLSDGDDLPGRYRTWTGTAWTIDNGNVLESAKFIADSIEAEVKPYREKLAKLQTERNTAELAIKDAKGQDKSDFELSLKQIERDIKQTEHVIKEFDSHIKSSASLPKQKAMIELLKSVTGFYLNFEKQAAHGLLSFKNGILDDRLMNQHLTLTDTADGIEHLQDLKFNYPIHYIDRTYIRNAKTPEFDNFLNPIFTDNTTEGLDEQTIIARRDETVKYFKRLLGYSMISGNPEQIFIMLAGTGNNGKSYLMNAIREIIGEDEFGDIDGQELLESTGGKMIRNTTADSAGKRFGYYSETNGNNLKNDVDQIKKVADEGVCIEGRKHENQRPQTINFTPWASMNDMLNFNKPLTYSILRRLLPIWFTHKFNSNPDAAVKDGRARIWQTVVQKEGDAIFSMMIDEAIAYLKEKEKGNAGLLPLPAFLTDKRAELLADASAIDFIETHFLPAPGKQLDENAILISQRDIEQMYVNYMKKTGRINELDVSLKNPTMDAYGNFEKITRNSKTRNDLRTALNVLGFGDYEQGRSRANYIWVCIKRIEMPQNYDHALMDLPMKIIDKYSAELTATTL